MSDPDPQEPLSMSENSFVILGHGSLPSLANGDLTKNTDSDSLSRSKSSLTNFESANLTSSDKFRSKLWSGSIASEEEIQKKFDELIRENSQLKDTLNQNNLAIKSQLDTFIMWQQEVLKTHETHKQKFLETKDLILKLRAENMSLKRQLEETPPKTLTENGSGIYAQINKKSEDLDNLKQKIEEYQQMYNDLSVKNYNLDTENQKLKEELKNAKDEVFKLNKQLEDVGRENMFLKQKIENGSKNSFESVPHNSEACHQIRNLCELEKGKAMKLTEELDKTKSNDSEMKLSRTQKLDQYLDKLNNMNDSFDKQSQRYTDLSSWVSLAEQSLKQNDISQGVEANIVSEIKQLKSHLNEEEDKFKEQQESVIELKKQFHKLLEDYKTLQVKLTSVKNNDLNNEKHSEEVARLLSQLEEKDQELILKQQECDELKETIKKLNLECEEVALLRVQVELYQSDFNDERAAREKLVGEKEDMAEKIRYLENRIKTLEKDNLNTDVPLESASSSPGNKTKYLCPRCVASFTDLDECEKHIQDCVFDTLF